MLFYKKAKNCRLKSPIQAFLKSYLTNRSEKKALTVKIENISLWSSTGVSPWTTSVHLNDNYFANGYILSEHIFIR